MHHPSSVGVASPPGNFRFFNIEKINRDLPGDETSVGGCLRVRQKAQGGICALNHNTYTECTPEHNVDIVC